MRESKTSCIPPVSLLIAVVCCSVLLLFSLCQKMATNRRIFLKLVDELCQNRSQTPRTVIFCRHILPPNIASFRFVENRKWRMKSLVISQRRISSKSRLDSSNIRWTIHWGTPSDIESYTQETGRAGRDGEQSQAKFKPSPWREYDLNDDTCIQVLLQDLIK